jgi:hypothetical protein
MYSRANVDKNRGMTHHDAVIPRLMNNSIPLWFCDGRASSKKGNYGAHFAEPQARAERFNIVCCIWETKKGRLTNVLKVQSYRWKQSLLSGKERSHLSRDDALDRPGHSRNGF